MTAIELKHVTSHDTDRKNSIYDDRRVGYREVGIHQMIVSAADSGDPEIAEKVKHLEMDDQDFRDAVDTLEYYGYLVRGEKRMGAPSCLWVILDTASVPGTTKQRDCLEASGYEVIEPAFLPSLPETEE